MADLFFDELLLPNGWGRDVRVAIADGFVAGLAPNASPDGTIERHAIGLPGMANLHSHAFQRGMAGLTEARGETADSFWSWREQMYRFVGLMTPEGAETIAALVYAEMLEAGFTGVGEFHYLHHDRDGAPYDDIAEMAQRIAAAADATGIGLTLLPVFYAHSGFGGRPPGEGQRRFINDPERFGRLVEGSRRAVAGLDGAVVGIAPHSLRAVKPDELAAIVPLAGGGPIHIHVSEQTQEVDDCFAWSGQPPVEWLLDHADVNEFWCLIHATHTNPAELAGIASRKAVVGLCPITEANLGDGIFDAQRFSTLEGRFGVGSDSNVLIGLSDELRQLEYSQRLAQRARNLMATPAQHSTGRALFDAALAGGAQALGRGAGLAVGAPADIVSLDANDPVLAARRGDALLDSLVFAAQRPLVDCVWVRGKKRVSGGRHDRGEAIRARFRQLLKGWLA